MKKKSKALVLIDLIEDIVGKEGLSNSSYQQFLQRNILEESNRAISFARLENVPIVWVKVGFADDYHDIPRFSPMFHQAKERGALRLNSPNNCWVKGLEQSEEDHYFIKKGVSIFTGNNLARWLEISKIDTLILGGVSSLLAIQSSAREAHELGFRVYVVDELCAAKSFELHQESMDALEGLATVISIAELKKLLEA